MTPDSEIAMIILAIVSLISGASLACIKMCQSNGVKCRHKSCLCGECEYDLRLPETKQKELELNSV